VHPRRARGDQWTVRREGAGDVETLLGRAGQSQALTEALLADMEREAGGQAG
jgi:hypothetical protein